MKRVSQKDRDTPFRFYICTMTISSTLYFVSILKIPELQNA